MFDSEKSKQQAIIILQQLQKHTNESLRSLALRIETLVKTAYSLYTEDYRNSVMNQTFIRCLDNELKNAALKKHANHKQTPREPEMPFKTLVEKIDQTDLTRTITNNHKRLYEVNQSTTNINEDLKQMNIACNNINELNQNDLEQFEGTICNVLNGINNTYDKKNFKGRPKFALFCSYCSSHGHTKGRCFKRPRRGSVTRPKERSFYSHMRNNQNLPNRRIDSNNVNGRQLPPTSPIYNNSRSRTPYRSHSRNNYHNRNSRDSRNNQGYQRSNNYNNRSTSYNRNNYNRNRSNSYHRSNSYNKYNNNNRSNSRYNDRNTSRQQSPYNSNKNNNSLPVSSLPPIPIPVPLPSAPTIEQSHAIKPYSYETQTTQQTPYEIPQPSNNQNSQHQLIPTSRLLEIQNPPPIDFNQLKLTNNKIQNRSYSLDILKNDQPHMNEVTYYDTHSADTYEI